MRANSEPIVLDTITDMIVYQVELKSSIDKSGGGQSNLLRIDFQNMIFDGLKVQIS